MEEECLESERRGLAPAGRATGGRGHRSCECAEAPERRAWPVRSSAAQQERAFSPSPAPPGSVAIAHTPLRPRDRAYSLGRGHEAPPGRRLSAPVTLSSRYACGSFEARCNTWRYR